MAKKFKELTKDFSPERPEHIEARKAKFREEMNLAELRQALSLTQNTLAEALGVGQAEISKIENRAPECRVSARDTCRGLLQPTGLAQWRQACCAPVRPAVGAGLDKHMPSPTPPTMA